MDSHKPGNNEKGYMLAGTLITLAGAGLWGLNAVTSKFLMARGMDTMWMVNFRMITSGFVLLVFEAIRNPRGLFDIWKEKDSVIRLLIIAAFAFGVCQTTYYLSINYSNAGIASVLQQTAPAFVLVYVMLREKRRPTTAEIITLPLVIFGSFLISTHGDPTTLSIHPIALAAGLISAITSAMYMIVPAGLIRRYGTMQTVGWGLFIGGCIIAPVCKLWNFPQTLDAVSIAGLAFIILPGAAFAFALFLYGTTLVGSVRAGVYNLFEPVVAVIASAVFLSQDFHVTEIIGIICVLLGIAIMTMTRADDPRH